MIEVLKKIWHFAGKEQKNISKSIFWGFFYAVFHMFQVGAIYYVVLALTGGDHSYQAAWTALGASWSVSQAVPPSTVSLSYSRPTPDISWWRTGGSRSVTNWKRIPMGYFNDKSLGEITGVTTTVLNVETMGPVAFGQYAERVH